VVEPGEIVLGFGRSSADIVATRSVRITGESRHVGFDRALHAEVVVTPEP
jgi:beta-xylosidase